MFAICDLNLLYFICYDLFFEFEFEFFTQERGAFKYLRHCIPIIEKQFLDLYAFPV